MALNVRRSTVKLAHNEMDFFTFGTGETPLVMLPGIALKSVMLSAEGIASAYRRLAERFTVYCFDRTKFLKKNDTIDRLSEDTAEAMTALGIQNACVFGASQGGMMAQYLAICHPDLVGKLLLGSTCSRMDPSFEGVLKQWVALAREGDPDRFCDGFIGLLYGKSFADRFGAFIKLMHRDATRADFDRFILLAEACTDWSLYDRLQEIRCPVLVLGAEDDRVLGAQASRDIAERLHCDCYLYGREYGHCVFDEAPDYKQRMADFFLSDRA